MSGLVATEHVGAVVVIAVATAVLVVLARRGPGPWLKMLALVLVLVEVSWWVYLLPGGQLGSVLAQSLPLQLCDFAIFVTAAPFRISRQAVRSAPLTRPR